MIQFRKRTRKQKVLPLTVQQIRDIAVGVMNSDEMYGLLPGNGEDDYIIAQFTKMLDEKLKPWRATV